MQAAPCMHERAQDPTLGMLPHGLSFHSRRWKKRTIGKEIQHLLQLKCPECEELFAVASELVCKWPCEDTTCQKVHYQQKRAATAAIPDNDSTGTPPPPLEDDFDDLETDLAAIAHKH